MDDPLATLVGIPFVDHGRTAAGADCWGLFRLAVLEIAGLDLPAYEDHYLSVAERKANADMIRGVVGDWRPVPAGEERSLDGIIMRDGRYESHVGLVVKPGLMLHTYQGGSSCVDRYHNSPFRERIVSFHRHAALENAF